jgi:hypothetical protein
MFGIASASMLWLTVIPVALLLCMGPWTVAGSGGLMDDEQLLYSTGEWHRTQRKRVTFENACYYSHEKELPYGRQYATSKLPVWRSNAVRSLERDVLQAFYTGTNGEGWRTSDNWNVGDPCWDAWYGITCDEHGHVIHVELVDNNLFGTIDPSLGSLESLLKFDVSTTAPQYHNHPNLHINRITGVLPSLAKIARIEEINLSGNEITALPEDLYENGHSLRLISASYNLLRQLPKYLNKFAKLHTLELDHNLISGSLPPDLGMMLEARYIHLDTNLLAGDMPTTIDELRRIRAFDVAHNPGLTSHITEDVIVNWAQVEYISILNTSISGYISNLCLDVPFCWKYMFDTHKDLTWATAADVPDVVNLTIELAKTNPDGPSSNIG